MNLMLAVILGCAGLGLFIHGFGRPVYLIIAALATVMTALYYFTTRFMT